MAAYFARIEPATYLPLRRVRSSRQDRKVEIEVPALPGYLFVRCALDPDTRALIKRHSSVVHLVESAGRPAEIPAAQGESIRRALLHTAAEEHPYLKLGDRVRVARGPLEGVEGYLVRIAGKRERLVITIDHVNQALSLEVDADCIEPAP